MSHFRLECPVPFSSDALIQMAHGGGGRMMQRLLDSVFFAKLGNAALDERHDAALLEFGGKRLALTTDAFVVTPYRFPGGDIGSLAVHGTVNDLAMAGARPAALAAAFVLEEGLPTEELGSLVASMSAAAEAAGVAVIAGDTKVVERGKGDGLYICTTGIGEVMAPSPVVPAAVRPGDAVIVSGDIGRHGASIMSVREGLELGDPIPSDSAAVHRPVLALFEAGIEVHCLRDATRGGLASVLNEISRDAGLPIQVEEDRVPVREDVRGICEILGLDPLYVACEGRFAAFVPAEHSERALEVMRDFPESEGAAVIGEVSEGTPRVTLTTSIGVERVLDLLSGEQLPRIC